MSSEIRNLQIEIPTASVFGIPAGLVQLRKVLASTQHINPEHISASLHPMKVSSGEKQAWKLQQRGIPITSIDVPDAVTWKDTILEISDALTQRNPVKVPNDIAWNLMNVGDPVEAKHQVEQVVRSGNINKAKPWTIRLQFKHFDDNKHYFNKLLQQYPLLNLAFEIDPNSQTVDQFYQRMTELANSSQYTGRVFVDFDYGHMNQALISNTFWETIGELDKVITLGWLGRVSLNPGPSHQGFVQQGEAFESIAKVLGTAERNNNLSDQIPITIIPEFIPVEYFEMLNEGAQVIGRVVQTFNRSRGNQ